MRLRNVALVLVSALLLALPAYPQGIPTGTLSGHVSGTDKKPLPGVTVTITSPALQGSRTVVTTATGDYLLPLLPAGEYKISFDLEGFQKAERQAKISAAQSQQVDVELALPGVAETIVVTGSADTISSTTETSTTYSNSTVEKLPLNRDPVTTIQLNPGVTANGPNNGITIAGAMSYESLYLVNGVVVNENLRGQPFTLYIEDAIQETTVSTSGISAEYGRFSGGVVNILTKSGGNEVHGTFRDWVTNPKWSAPTPVTTTRLDTTNQRYEGTLGGWLLKDRLWYFGAARNFDLSGTGQTGLTNIAFPTDTKETRWEGKLTVSPTDGQRLVGTYNKIKHDEIGNTFGTVLDTLSLVNRQLPQELIAGNYNGVFSESFFAEAQYSRRKFSFIHSGGLFTDIPHGSLVVDNNTGFFYNAPAFCGICTPELRNNNDYLVKGSWFASTPSLGSHDVAFGYDSYNDIRKANNHQSGSDYRLFSADTVIRNGQPFPVFLGQGGGFGSTFIVWDPIFLASLGTNFRTNSLYANDHWRFNDHFTFNLGVRYDKNDGKNSAGAKTASDSKVSPRVGLAYDVKSDGDITVYANYGTYVDALANTVGDGSSSAGTPAVIGWLYGGPDINGNPNGPLLSGPDAITAMFNWFNSVGGTNNTSFLFLQNIPGATTQIRGSLKSPSTDEYTVGLGKRLGRYGFLRADYIHRQATDFYVTRTDQTTGRTTTATGRPADLNLIQNSTQGLSRKFDGLLTQFQGRAFDRLNYGVSYTLSETKGNVVGETAGSGPVTTATLQYPEYKDPAWNNPTGDLAGDQRHRVVGWGTFDFWRNEHNSLTAGLVEYFFTGRPYGAVGAVADRPFVHNPGYVTPPANVAYFFTARDAFRTPNINETDLSLSYGFHFGLFAKDVEIFLEPQILNVFNNHDPLTVNTTVRDATTLPTLATFNPFTTKPVEGVNWIKGPNFGKGLVIGDFQQPRTYRFSVGFRF